MHQLRRHQLRLLRLPVQRRYGGALERVRAVVERLAWTVALLLGVSACEGRVNATDEAPLGLRAALSARIIYPAKREEWRSDITTHTDSTMVPGVLRASRTTVALLQSSPTRISQFELNRRGMLLSSRPARIDPILNAQVPRDILAPTDLSRVTAEGQLDIVDSASSTLVRESIGGFVFRRELPLLRGGSGRLCTMAPSTLLHLRLLGDRRTLEAFTITGNASDDALVGRHRFTGAAPRLRFGGGDARRCLLIAEREVFVVSAPTGVGAGVPPRLALLQPPGGSAQATMDDSAFAASAEREGVQQPLVVDAAIVDGGFVVLVGVVSDRRGRIVDYYDERGQYLQSAMLPFTASALAGAGPRFLVLHQDPRFRWWLSSWITPMAARGATPPSAPRQVDQAPEKQVFEPPTARGRVPR